MSGGQNYLLLVMDMVPIVYFHAMCKIGYR